MVIIEYLGNGIKEYLQKYLPLIQRGDGELVPRHDNIRGSAYYAQKGAGQPVGMTVAKRPNTYPRLGESLFAPLLVLEPVDGEGGMPQWGPLSGSVPSPHNYMDSTARQQSFTATAHITLLETQPLLAPVCWKCRLRSTRWIRMFLAWPEKSRQYRAGTFIRGRPSSAVPCLHYHYPNHALGAASPLPSLTCCVKASSQFRTVWRMSPPA